MNYSSEEIGKKIKLERQNRNWTQKQLGNKLNISDKQVSNYEKGVLTPPTNTLLDLCSVFGCELGYFLGEEDYNTGTKLNTAIERTLGLNTDSINALQLITGTERKCLSYGHEADTYRRILNKLLCAPEFRYLLESLYRLDSCNKCAEQVSEHMQQKYGDKILNTAHEYYNSTTDYLYDKNAPKLDEIYYQAIADIDFLISKRYDLSFAFRVNRYEVRESFERLIDSLYPKEI